MMLLGHGRTHPATGFDPKRLQLDCQPLALRFALHHEASVPYLKHTLWQIKFSQNPKTRRMAVRGIKRSFNRGAGLLPGPGGFWAFNTVAGDGFFTFRSNTTEQGGGGFVGTVFVAGEFGFGRDQFAAERFGENSLGQFVSTPGGGSDALLDLIGEFKEGFYWIRQTTVNALSGDIALS
jgi:hypothetical protein